MEWFEILFQQTCAHLITRARTAHQRREDGRLIADQAGLFELIDSYRRPELKVVFEVPEVRRALDAGSECVLLVHVREDQFTRPAQELIRDREKREIRQVLAASMEIDSVSPESAGHQFDVVLCRLAR